MKNYTLALLLVLTLLAFSNKPPAKNKYVLADKISTSLATEIEKVKIFLNHGKKQSYYLLIESSGQELDIIFCDFTCKKCPISKIVESSNRYILINGNEYKVISFEDLAFSEFVNEGDNIVRYGYGNGYRMLFNSNGELKEKYFTQ